MSACQKRKKATTHAVAFLDEGDGESDRRNSHGAACRCRHGKRCRVNTVPRACFAVQFAKTLRQNHSESFSEKQPALKYKKQPYSLQLITT